MMLPSLSIFIINYNWISYLPPHEILTPFFSIFFKMVYVFFDISQNGAVFFDILNFGTVSFDILNFGTLSVDNRSSDSIIAHLFR